MRVRVLMTIAAGLVGGALSSPADACEPFPCEVGSLLPSGGTIPVNATSVRWDLRKSMKPAEARALVTMTRDGKDVPFDLEVEDPETYRIVPKGGWVEGATYTVNAKNTCEYLGPKTHVSMFTVGPKAPLPTSLGAVTFGDPGTGALMIGTDSGSCSVTEPAVWADLKVELSPEAKPWAAMLDFTPDVDGKPWVYADTLSSAPPRGASVLGRGKARVYARCQAESEAFEGAGPGMHVVGMRATVYGTSVELDATPLTLSLDCAGGAKAVSDEPAPHASEAPPPAPSSPSPEASNEAAGAHAKAGGCGVGGGSPWVLPLLWAFRFRRRGLTEANA